MNDADRFRLIGGPYRPPKARPGAVLICLVRDRDCVVTDWTDARLSWPKGKPKGARAVAIIVTDELARAVATESNQALCHWLGLTPQTISKWRKALDVPKMTAGTTKLWQGYYPERVTPKVFRKAIRRASTPEANAKKSVAKLGVPRPKHVRKILDRTGKPASDETRAKQSAAHRKRGTWPPAAGRQWTADEDQLVRTLTPTEVAKKTKRTLTAVYSRRALLRFAQ